MHLRRVHYAPDSMQAILHYLINLLENFDIFFLHPIFISLFQMTKLRVQEIKKLVYVYTTRSGRDRILDQVCLIPKFMLSLPLEPPHMLHSGHVTIIPGTKGIKERIWIPKVRDSSSFVES